MRDDKRTNEQTLKIELLSQWKLEAEFCNSKWHRATNDYELKGFNNVLAFKRSSCKVQMRFVVIAIKLVFLHVRVKTHIRYYEIEIRS